MRYVLDTNVCIFGIKGIRGVEDALARHQPGELAVTTITLAELWFGAKKSRSPADMRRLQDAFLEPFAILEFDAAAAASYADVRSHLEHRGTPIGERDLMIASIARSQDLVIVTHNLREFQRVPDLVIEDWTTS